jgi:hypothetical protein
MPDNFQVTIVSKTLDAGLQVPMHAGTMETPHARTLRVSGQRSVVLGWVGLSRVALIVKFDFNFFLLKPAVY